MLCDQKHEITTTLEVATIQTKIKVQSSIVLTPTSKVSFSKDKTMLQRNKNSPNSCAYFGESNLFAVTPHAAIAATVTPDRTIA